MNTPADPALPGQCSNPSDVARVAAAFGLSVLDDDGIRQARDLSVALLGDVVAPAETFCAVQRAVGAAMFGFREAGVLTAVLAAFPLNYEGLAHLRAGTFDAVNLDVTLVAGPGERPGAYYGWGFAATTKDGGRAVLRASAEIHRQLYWATPTFARAVTTDGLRALTALGFKPVVWGDPGLLCIDPPALGAAL